MIGGRKLAIETVIAVGETLDAELLENVAAVFEVGVDGSRPIRRFMQPADFELAFPTVVEPHGRGSLSLWEIGPADEEGETNRISRALYAVRWSARFLGPLVLVMPRAPRIVNLFHQASEEIVKASYFWIARESLLQPALIRYFLNPQILEAVNNFEDNLKVLKSRLEPIAMMKAALHGFMRGGSTVNPDRVTERLRPVWDWIATKELFEEKLVADVQSVLDGKHNDPQPTLARLKQAVFGAES